MGRSGHRSSGRYKIFRISSDYGRPTSAGSRPHGRIAVNIFESGTVKSIAIGLVMSAVGFGSHQVIESVSQAHQLESQSAQIQKLFEGQSETHTQVQDLSVALARMEGKLDVLNQKIDDDRSKTRR
jgi:hypothetical protein